MPRFHFNVLDGKTLLDPEGTELPDIQAARVEALRLAGEIVRDDASRISFGEEWRIEVADEDGLILFVIDLAVSESPATKRRSPAA